VADKPAPFKKIVVNDRVAEEITRVEELSYEIKIDEVMSSAVKAISPDLSMRNAVETFRTNRISGAPVVDKENKLIGVLSMEDLIRCLMVTDLDSNVEKYMTKNVLTVNGRDSVVEALKLFVNSRVGRLPVINSNGKLAGILTKGDITRGLLKALQTDYKQEELKKYRASHLFEDIESDRTSLILRYFIKANDFTQGGAASTAIKRALLRLGASPMLARRCSIAIYEAEMNLIIHTNEGGYLRVEIEPHRITIETKDDGPGIADVKLAQKPGYSTATEEIRELGFGAGMGLTNMSRCVDNLVLESTLGKGTHLKMRLLLKEEETVGEGYQVNKETN
jgi:CBS domain-containing protein/anti-sigma regulatory factor (Ser/Thr protein kinase)